MLPFREFTSPWGEKRLQRISSQWEDGTLGRPTDFINGALHWHLGLDIVFAIWSHHGQPPNSRWLRPVPVHHPASGRRHLEQYL